MGCLDGIVRIGTGLIILLIAAGLASCQPLFPSPNAALRLTAGDHGTKIMLDRITSLWHLTIRGMEPLGDRHMTIITAKKDHWGKWVVESDIDLPNVKAKDHTGLPGDPLDAFVRISTSKNLLGDLQSHATVCFRTASGFTHAIGGPSGDYSASIIRRPGRATEKALRALHEEALGHLDLLLTHIGVHYGVAYPAGEKVAA